MLALLSIALKNLGHIWAPWKCISPWVYVATRVDIERSSLGSSTVGIADPRLYCGFILQQFQVQPPQLTAPVKVEIPPQHAYLLFLSRTWGVTLY